MSIGSADGVIEVILKINDNTGKITETAIKTADGKLVDFSKLEDPEWWRDQYIKYSKIGIKYTLESLNSNLNYGNISNFICESSAVGVNEYNEKLAQLAGTHKDYSKWIANADALISGAEDLVSLSEQAFNIAEGIDTLGDLLGLEGNNADRGRAIQKITSGLLHMSSTIVSHVPGIAGECVSTILSVAADTFDKGATIIVNYIQMLEELDEAIEEIIGENNESIQSDKEGIQALNEMAEAYKDFLPSSIKNQINELNQTLSDYETAVNNYENKKQTDVDGDGKIAGGKSYNPDDKGNAGGSDADGKFNDGKTSRVDPIVLDLGNNGFNPTSLNGGVNFDLDGNGMAERINWIQGDDAILAYDKNEDGVINDGTEVFGDNTILKSGEKAANGFEALAEFDSNGDGIINAEDERFEQLLVWQDLNGNGISDEGELKTLTDMHIESINLDYSKLSTNTKSGTVLGNVGTFSFTDGTESRMAEYWVMSQKFNTVDTNPIEIPEQIAALPNVNGMGNVYSLHKAMTLDATGRLTELVTSFMDTTDESTRKSLISDMLMIMTGAENTEDGSRGVYMDAKKLTALECLLGQEFEGQNGADPNSAATPLLNAAYDTIINMYYCELLAQTTLKKVLPYILVEETDGVTKLDLSIFNQYLRFNNAFSEDGAVLIADAASYLRYLDNYYLNPDLQTVGKNNVNQINWSLYLSDFGFSKTKLIIFSTFSR